MRWVEIGRIVRAHGLSGRVKVLSYLESDRLLPSLTEAWVGRSRDSAKRYPIENARPEGRAHFSLKLGGVEDRTAAEGLRGLAIFVPYSILGALPEGEYYWEDLIGLRVETEDGRALGVIEGVFPTGSNDVIVCRAGTREILLPAIAEVIRAVDVGAGRMVVRLLKGLEAGDDAL
ncbi:MAG: 16S rRNA processing protein RimM [Syntrophaceae bacterium]|nr:16S rRNA processing protein RimM [Syntrophaceae bacterium]